MGGNGKHKANHEPVEQEFHFCFAVFLHFIWLAGANGRKSFKFQSGNEIRVIEFGINLFMPPTALSG